MNSHIEAEAVRARTLIIALRALLECASMLDENSDQISGCVFLLTELSDTVEKLLNIPRPAND